MSRFVILRHEAPAGASRPTHWDLMLEAADALRTWALTRAPERDVWIDAEELPEHRKAYLDYEGPVSGGRGRVTRWDAGDLTWEKDSPREVDVRLTGGRLRARASLRRCETGGQGWRVLFSPD